ncbi:hypothetical protein [Burkholderia sp. MSMB1826]|uniref:hypothetical protein n=1 Tax=Burkholderia sp. MSMB1826 TaxID=1637875 RepID=UPI00075708DC|nr:hypothetical protein [Burkholderia sp. MSMB1826]KVL18781.1 hypothetical protein WS95_16180 [Burkholderia sp. MSMB1826]
MSRIERSDAAKSDANLRFRLAEALSKSALADDARYERLPAFVRFRATGAAKAWEAWRRGVEQGPNNVSEMLRTRSIVALVNQFDELAKRLLPYGTPEMMPDEAGKVAAHSALWQAFELRNGMIFEPTPPLHRLLDDAYISDDVPIGAVEFPADTLCIIPEPSSWGKGERSDATIFFRNGQTLACATWVMHLHDGQRNATVDVVELPLDNPDRTIGALLDEVCGSSETFQTLRAYLRGSIDYAVKMLLYLKARDAHVVQERAYSDAPRSFPGLGQRKRNERMAEIEMLYDRHLVGPAILDAESANTVPMVGNCHEVRGHWRRPHFRMQPYGPQASLRKLVFIGPTIVRPDRLDLS